MAEYDNLLAESDGLEYSDPIGYAVDMAGRLAVALRALQTENTELREKQAKVRDWAIELVASDDMSKWASHAGYAHGTAILKMIDGKPDGVWDSRTSDWGKEA